MVPSVERIGGEPASRAEERLTDRPEATTYHHEFGIEDGDQVGDSAAQFCADFRDQTSGNFVAGVGCRRHILAPDRAGIETMGERTLRVEADDLTS